MTVAVGAVRGITELAHSLPLDTQTKRRDSASALVSLRVLALPHRADQMRTVLLFRSKTLHLYARR